MLATLLRLTLLVGLIFGGYKIYPLIKPAITPIITNQKVLGAEITTPVIDSINNILPANIHLPRVSTKAPSPSDSATSSSSNQSYLSGVVDQVKQKAGEAAQSQIDIVKKETGNAFCAALIETIKKQCGVQ